MSERPAPPNGNLATITEAWLNGDAEALLSWVAKLDEQWLTAVVRMWWELSTTLGEVAEPPQVCRGERVVIQGLAFEPPLMTGGAPPHLVNVDVTRDAWLSGVRSPLSRTRHREAMRETCGALLAGRHPRPDDAFALLRHHTGAPVDFFAGRPLYETLSPEDLAAELGPLAEVLAGADAFDSHLQAGLSSESRARRDLSWRLLRLTP